MGWMSARRGKNAIRVLAVVAVAGTTVSLASSTEAARPTAAPISRAALASSGLKLPFVGTWEINRGPTGPGHGALDWDFSPIGTGSRNDRVVAVAGGTAKLACADSVGQATVKLVTEHGTFGYAHLQTSAVKAYGITAAGVKVAQGQVLGRLYPAAGTFGSANWAAGSCGYGSGSHLHFTLPRKPITIDGKTFTGTSPGSGRITSTNKYATKPTFTASSPATLLLAGAAYNYAFKASGTPAPTFTRVSGALPPGLTLTSTGRLSGTPTTAGPYTFTVKATNGVGSVTVSRTIQVLPVDADGNGLPDDGTSQQTDVNGDGRPDIVGFGNDAVSVSLGTGTAFDTATTWSSQFVTSSGWRNDRHPRHLLDVNNDGLPDIVGFSNDKVMVALNNGTSFAGATNWLSDFGYGTTWDVVKHPRFLVDVNDDSLPDIVGFGTSYVYVSLNTGTAFSATAKWSSQFTHNGGWRTSRHPRTVTDVNDDGLPDLVGFANAGVMVALNTGTSFATASYWHASFGYDDSWRVETHPRTITDVNNDGLPDVVGFGTSYVYVALNTGSSFAPSAKWSTQFVYNSGWRTAKHPRILTDVDDDGRPDIVGFHDNAVYVARNTGSAFATATSWRNDFGYGNTWRVDRHPRVLADVDADGRPDVVGFGTSSVYVSRNTGTGFAPKAVWSTQFVWNSGWRVDKHRRLLGG